jgi:hypothetical protein
MIVTLTNFDDGKPVCILKSQIFYFRHSKAMNTMIVASVGGAFAPVRETEAEIKALLTQAQEEPQNGTN